MAILRIPDENLTITEAESIAAYLSGVGVTYERWDAAPAPPRDASDEEVLAAYAPEVERLKSRGGYATADAVSLSPQTAGLPEMLARFRREHWHDEDEVRFIVHGRGLFHVRPRSGPVVAIEVAAGDLLCIPSGTWHWFDLCGDMELRAVRLFQKKEGWVPYYTESGLELKYQPVCLGDSYVARPRQA